MRAAALAAAAALWAVGCGDPAATSIASSGGSPPTALAAAEHADDALRAAYLGADIGPLAGFLAGPALVAARRQVVALADRGGRREERLLARREVHESRSGDRAEVVLEIQSEQRVIAAGQATGPATRSLRQWRAELAFVGGRWWVVDAGDLPPPQWWRAPEG